MPSRKDLDILSSSPPYMSTFTCGMLRKLHEQKPSIDPFMDLDFYFLINLYRNKKSKFFTPFIK